MLLRLFISACIRENLRQIFEFTHESSRIIRRDELLTNVEQVTDRDVSPRTLSIINYPLAIAFYLPCGDVLRVRSTVVTGMSVFSKIQLAAMWLSLKRVTFMSAPLSQFLPVVSRSVN